jgi:Ni,Fe-hydrogenase III large subunit
VVPARPARRSGPPRLPSYRCGGLPDRLGRDGVRGRAPAPVSTVRDRFTGTTVLTTDAARAIGARGYVARAGDVLARFLVRAAEIDTSLALIEQLAQEPTAPRAVLGPPLGHGTGPGAGVGLAEGWRGTNATRVELAADAP